MAMSVLGLIDYTGYDVGSTGKSFAIITVGAVAGSVWIDCVGFGVVTCGVPGDVDCMVWVPFPSNE